MGFLTWLFGKKDVPAGSDAREWATGPESARSDGRMSRSEADNLRRWQETGQARAWVEAHQGRWDHAEWLALLEQLKKSPYWPMQPDMVGVTLEEVRREWLRRN